MRLNYGVVVMLNERVNNYITSETEQNETTKAPTFEAIANIVVVCDYDAGQ